MELRQFVILLKADIVSKGLNNIKNYKELISALKLCVKYQKANDALWNLESAVDAIEQLIKERDILFKNNSDAITDLCAEINTLRYERDAAIADIEKHCRYCVVCKNADFTDGYTHNRCRRCLDEENRYFEWRGVQEVEHDND